MAVNFQIVFVWIPLDVFHFLFLFRLIISASNKMIFRTSESVVSTDYILDRFLLIFCMFTTGLTFY